MSELAYLLMGRPHPMPWAQDAPRACRSRNFAKVRAERTAAKDAKKSAVIKAIEARFYAAEDIAKAVGVTVNWARKLLNELAAEGRVAKQTGNQSTYWVLAK